MPAWRPSGRAGLTPRLVLNSRLRPVLRWLLSALLILALLRWVDLSALGPALSEGRYELLGLALILQFGNRITAAYRWKWILEPYEASVRIATLIRISFISSFFANFLPSSLSADAIRGYFLRRDQIQIAAVVSSVVLDRVVGFAALVLLAVGAGVIALWQGILESGVFAAVLISLGSLLLVVLALVSPGFLAMGARLQASPVYLLREAGNAVAAIHQYPWTGGRLLKVMVLAAFVTAYGIVTSYVFFLSLHDPLPIGYFFLIMPVVILLTSLPISVGGLGVQEGALVIMLGALGVEAGHALLFGLVLRAASVVASLPGGLFYAFDRSQPLVGKGSKSSEPGPASPPGSGVL